MNTHNKIRLIVFISIVVFTAPADCQNYTWAKNFGGTNTEDANAIAVDAAGNVYTTGFFYYSGDYDPGPGVHTLSGPGGSNCFISKLDANGDFVWAKALIGSDVNGQAIAVDQDGNVYVTGYFSNSLDFDPGAGTVNLVSNGQADAFILKLNSNGDFIRVQRFGSSDFDWGYAVTCDQAGNVYLGGKFHFTVDFDPGPAVYNLTSNYTNAYICKLDTSGSLVWAKSYQGSAESSTEVVQVDQDFNVYTAGVFRSTMDFNPDTAVDFLLTSNGLDDIFVCKLESNGNFVWAKSMGAALTNEIPSSISLDPDANVLITGSFGDSVDFDPGPGSSYLSTGSPNLYNCFICKLDSSGNFNWAKSLRGANSKGYSISTNSFGESYIGGNVNYCDMDPGPGTYNTSGNTLGGHAFVLKLDDGGNFSWVRVQSSPRWNTIYGIACDAAGQVYAAGHVQDTTLIDSVSSFYLYGLGYSDVFVAKIGDQTVGINENVPEGNFILFPNPTSGNFILQTDKLVNEMTVELYDAIGNLLSVKRYQGLNRIEEQLTSVGGIYFVRVITDHQVNTFRAVKN